MINNEVVLADNKNINNYKEESNIINFSNSKKELSVIDDNRYIEEKSYVERYPYVTVENFYKIKEILKDFDSSNNSMIYDDNRYIEEKLLKKDICIEDIKENIFINILNKSNKFILNKYISKNDNNIICLENKNKKDNSYINIFKYILFQNTNTYNNVLFKNLSDVRIGNDKFEIGEYKGYQHFLLETYLLVFSNEVWRDFGYEDVVNIVIKNGNDPVKVCSTSNTREGDWIYNVKDDIILSEINDYIKCFLEEYNNLQDIIKERNDNIINQIIDLKTNKDKKIINNIHKLLNNNIYNNFECNINNESNKIKNKTISNKSNIDNIPKEVSRSLEFFNLKYYSKLTLKSVRQASKELLLKYHPDKYKGEDGNEKTIEILNNRDIIIKFLKERNKKIYKERKKK